MKQIAKGAEARLYRDVDALVKERVRKGYRVSELDLELRKARTRHEARLLEKLKAAGLKVPKLLKCSEEKNKIEMEFIDGKKLSENFILPACTQIGAAVAALHAIDIIHGDLTTSNMILKGKELYLIDFGLSYHSNKIEDKAVDLHLLKQALQSKHHTVWEKAFKLFLKGYRKYKDQALVLARLERVEQRGRYKH